MVPWLSRTALDTIGVATANYDLQAIDGGQPNSLTQAYSNILNMKRIKRYMQVVRASSQDVVDKQTALFAEGKGGSKNLMSILNPYSTFFFAGHGSTSSTMAWALYELSNHPEYQTKLRGEIKTTRAGVTRRGDGEMTILDFDLMHYLPALVKAVYEQLSKETLRYHPIVCSIARQSNSDTSISLDIPITLVTGEVVDSFPIERGQEIILSIFNYNRLKSVWGEDADEWRPERFLENHGLEQRTKLGLVSNLASFSSGVRGCIGLLQMQSILFELIDNFEFSPPPGDVEILRAFTGTMAPMYVR
ncbi:hypothetical protein Clacol_005938 [Clathrus columnatus]|uniref:Cytochrome P450 n=1 Tax=Clathrus columnatus TaxID=1419009 RepID=A0AAV5AAP4_9AGAM|nr:hypothetical protein Clacol_005938 [Clathrus columnatus]